MIARVKWRDVREESTGLGDLMDTGLETEGDV
jgi:hypothetical protein